MFFDKDAKMSMTYTKEDLQIIWQKQLTVLSFRKPGWLIKQMLTLTLILLPLTIGFQGMLNGFENLNLIFESIFFGAYVAFTICLYIPIRKQHYEKSRKKRNRYLLSWMYGTFDFCSLMFMSAVFLRLSLVGFALSGFNMMYLKPIILTVYVSILVTSIILSPRIIRSGWEKKKKGLGPEKKWPLAIGSFILSFGILSGPLMRAFDMFWIGFYIFAGLGLLGAFLLISISSPGLNMFAAMAMGGFNPEMNSDDETPGQQT
jgi:hypothetical protein